MVFFNSLQVTSVLMATKSLHAQLGASSPRREFPEPAAAPQACQVCVLKHFNFGPAELSQQVSCEEKLRNFLVLKLIRQHFCMGGSFLTLLVNFSSTVSSLRLISKLPHEWEERMNTIRADHPLFLWERGSLFVFDSLTTVLSPFLQPGKMRLEIRENLYIITAEKALEFLPSEAAEALPLNLQIVNSVLSALRQQHKASTNFQLRCFLLNIFGLLWFGFLSQ